MADETLARVFWGRVERTPDRPAQQMKRAGAWVFSGGLHDASTATVVRVNDGELLITDGPYTEGKEHLGGFTIIKAADLDGALDWGRKLATVLTPLAIEVRPFHDDATHERSASGLEL